MGLDSDLNLVIELVDSLPKRISFSMSTNPVRVWTVRIISIRGKEVSDDVECKRRMSTDEDHSDERPW